ncbi:MAG: ATP-binding protein [Lachnospiraceae bacterium]|nr:ATP-binding protein [Lachnospiraceae bacterium]
MYKRGKKIRAGDRSLVTKWTVSKFLTLFLLLSAIFNVWQIFVADWSSYSLGLNFITVYTGASIIISLVLAAAAIIVYRKKFYDKLRQLYHRQKIARMVYENGWYEKTIKKSVSSAGRSSSRDSISWWPRMYYRMDKGRLYILVEISMGKYQKQLLHLEEKLESGLFCELEEKELFEDFVQYVLLYDNIANRITIDEVIAAEGRLKLMANVWWEYDKLPHMLIAGGTGGGKTYFILTLIQALLKSGAVMDILDPKNADLADLSAVMPRVYHTKDDISDAVDRFYNEMMQRSESMKKMPGYKTGENYAYIGLEPHFLIFDEYVAYMEMLGTRESMDVLNKLKQIVMLGRQAGFFIILACQRPDAKYLGDGIRDQFNFRVALGKMSELGYSMMFGETNKDFFLKNIRGRGYLDSGKNVITEFYTPLVPKGYDFLDEIGRAASANNFVLQYSSVKPEVKNGPLDVVDDYNDF